MGWVPGWWAAAWAGSPPPGSPGAWWRGSPWAHGVGTSPAAAPACGTSPPAARFWGPQAQGPPLGPGRGSLTCTFGRASAPAWPPAALRGAGTLSTGLSPSAPCSPLIFFWGGDPQPHLLPASGRCGAGGRHAWWWCWGAAGLVAGGSAARGGRAGGRSPRCPSPAPAPGPGRWWLSGDTAWLQHLPWMAPTPPRAPQVC